MPKFRSKAEARFAHALTSKGIKFEYEPEKWDYHRKLVSSFCGACNHKEVYQRKKYAPDFYFPDFGFYIELKGRMTSRDRTKYIAVKQLNPTKDLRIVCLADNKLSKTSTKRYSDWLRENGFKYKISRVPPPEWFRATSRNKARQRKTKS